MTYLDNLNALDASLLAKLSAIRLAVFDVDGVLTNGNLYYGSDGESLKVFNVKDGVGFKLLSDQGIKVAVISAKSSAMVDQRMKDLGVKYVFTGVKDKPNTLLDLITRFGLKETQCCYVGDDMVDALAMSAVGVAMCPADAYAFLHDKVDHVCPVNGGEGVARYVCDSILVAKGQFEEAYKLAAMPNFERKR